MKYEIKGDLTQITYETRDQHQKQPREQGKSRAETIICQPKGGCSVVAWPPRESKELD